MEGCITRLPEVNSEEEVAGGALKKWPDRAFAVPPRISMVPFKEWMPRNLKRTILCGKGESHTTGGLSQG